MLDKIKQKFKDRKLFRKHFCRWGIFLFLGALLAPWVASAGMVDSFLYTIIETFAKATVWSIESLVNIAKYNEFTTSAAVNIGWVVVRDIANMFFIVIMMIIAVSTIIRVESYNYKNMLGRLLVKAVLINFSKMFCGLLIDLSQIITLTFVDAFGNIGKGNLISALGMEKLFSLAESGNLPSGGSVTTALLANLVFITIAMVVIFSIMIVFLFRIAAFWFLIVLSPFTFLLTAAGDIGGKYADRWWSEFGKYLIIGPVLSFFIWLSFLVMSQTNLSNITSKLADEKTPTIAIGDSLLPRNLSGYLVAVALLICSLVAAQEIGALGANVAMSVAKGSGRLAGKGSWGAAKWAGRWSNALQAKYITGKLPKIFGEGGINLNPWTFKEKIKKGTADRQGRLLKVADGKTEAIADYGVGRFIWNKWRKGFGVADIIDEKREEEIENRNKLLRMKLKLGGERNAAGRERYQEAIEKLKELSSELENTENEKRLYQSSIETQEKNKYETTKDGTTFFDFKDQKGNIIRSIKKEDWEKEKGDNIEGFDKRIKELEEEQEKEQKIVDMVEGEDKIEEGLEKLTLKIADEEGEKIKLKQQDIENIQSGMLSYSETLAELSKIVSRLDELKNLEEKKGRLTLDQSQEYEKLEKRKSNLEKYAQATENGEKVKVENLFNEENITKYTKEQLELAENKKIIKKSVEELNNQIEDHKQRKNIIKESAEDDYEIKLDLADIKKEIRDNMKEIEKIQDRRRKTVGPPKYFVDVARRSLIAEEQKKYSDVKEASELFGYFRQAQAEKDFYRAAAILRQMAQNGDDNEFLNFAGYDSDFPGMKKFFENEIIKKMKVSDQTAISLANDIGYINEGINHWETSRVASSKNGKWRWNTEEEHTKSAVAEILKKGSLYAAQRYNRLAFGGETQMADGSRKFHFTNVGKIMMAAFGEDFQRHIAARKEGTYNLVMNFAQDIDPIIKLYDRGIIRARPGEADLLQYTRETVGTKEKGVRDVDRLYDMSNNL